MFGEENGLGRERRPEEEKAPEREESFLERFQSVEESEQEEDVETLISQVALALRQRGREEMDLMWSSLEPRDERLWKRKGNTIRSITLRDGHYAEHVELGVCELRGGFRESLEALRKRSLLQVVCLTALGPSSSRSPKLRFLETRGGTENWKEEFEAAVKDLLAGETPDRMVLSLAGVGEVGLRYASSEGEETAKIVLDREEEDLVLRLPPDLAPREARIELPEGPLTGKREEPTVNVWRFSLGRGTGWHVVLYRPLVLEFSDCALAGAELRPLWPSVSVVEFLEIVSRTSKPGKAERDSQ